MPIGSGVRQPSTKETLPLQLKTRYFICDHGRAKAVSKKVAIDASSDVASEASSSSEVVAKIRRVSKKASIKVNCPARITEIISFNSSVNVEYEWHHIYHDPLAALDLTSSRLQKAIKGWINQQVESSKDWKATKATLCLSENNLDAFDMSQAFLKVPAGLLVRYADAYNVIFAKMNKLSRKNPIDMESVRL
ncbi:hypothetical protein BCV72DRAFT_266057 [Rhizopus microsporus var. microsporus]|uniref:Uncharacterized protein n=2 Tax=Rhizopus microsporus TaxID=58291 RepID=A0A2G4SME1_RHIZD|nr:uncharacterized protein RHIMIDRAFT_315041 [Rhizopus microsporus ATCC 52813]ORE01005.1 hypothetical protein BCV72DRAFT_266057 [Rhizopus microsporus var. microsporus]PHZ09933.1 hypothetical protein RHIMIDRAFT_315041 [Rhizopus microsporus ATCC 52813]